MASQSRTKVLFIVPDGAINPRMGGGQRSAIFFSALKTLGAVDVVILGTGTGTQGQEFFSGAASVQWIYSDRFSIVKKKGLSWLLYNLRRFVFVPWFYSPAPDVTAELEGILTNDHRIVLCRYARPFCVAGLSETNDRRVFVDIDDRDDSTFLSAARSIFGDGLVSSMFEKLVVPAVYAQLRKRLQSASLVWYATAEDDLNIPNLPTSVLKNVPFLKEVPSDILPPSHMSDVLFVGAYGHRPNQDGIRWFLTHCWAKIHARHPHTNFRIVGLGDWSQLRTEFSDLTGVEYVGTVDDISDAYASSRLVVSPLFDGGGSKIKVIEACAFGRPIVVSTHSARGFGAAMESALPQANDPENYIKLCNTYLSEAETADQLGRALQILQNESFSRSVAENQIVSNVRVLISAQK